MNTSPDKILRPKTAEEAGALLDQLGDQAGLLWWGGRVELPSIWTRPTMIDLSGLDLQAIAVGDGRLVLGGLTPLQSLVESDEVHAQFGGILHTAARRTAHYGLRNLATLGGALFSPGGPPELGLALLAIGGEAVFAGEKERVAPLEEVLGEAGPTGLVTEVRLPLGPGAGAGWGLAWVARSPMDMALAAASVGLRLSEGAITAARVAVASVGLGPRRLPAAEAALEGKKAAQVAPAAVKAAVKDAVAPAADFRGTPEYQAEMMAQLAARAVSSALEGAGAK